MVLAVLVTRQDQSVFLRLFNIFLLSRDISLRRFTNILTSPLLILSVFKAQHKKGIQINTALLVLKEKFDEEHVGNILVDLLILIEISYEFLVNVFWVALNIVRNSFSYFRMQNFKSIYVHKVFCLTNKLVKTRRHAFFLEDVHHLLIILTNKLFVLRKSIQAFPQEDENIQNKVSIGEIIVL